MLKNSETMEQQMSYLKLHYMSENYDETVQQALKEKWSHIDCISSLVAGEAAARWDRSTQRRVTMARFPVIKTVEQFKWSWPTKIDRLGIQNLFHLKFIANKENIIFIGSVGVGKSHLATALGYAACLKGHSVLFTTAIDVINAMSAAKAAGRLKSELKRYLRPEILILDELGYLPIDKHGANLLFQVISHRYERGSMIITSNRAYKHWMKIFDDDATLTSAILDRLLHHSETNLIEGPSYRMKDQLVLH
ncbi:IS21-like element helper ATPase IstB [bacterium]|nr:IS21-like element helper ATPase IstB [bacterium]